MNILFATPEMAGYLKTGGLGDVAWALPEGFIDAGHEAASIMPLYAGLKIDNKRLSIVTELAIEMGGETFTAQILKDEEAGKAERLFIRQAELYGTTENPYGDEAGDYKNNDARFIFFCRAVIEYAKKAEARPDIIHANDWQGGLIPLLLKEELTDNASPLAGCRSILSIHNLAYQGHFEKNSFALTGLPESRFTEAEHYGKLAMLKSGIVAADGVMTVSRTYAEEMLTPKLGFGLEPFLKEKGERLAGVVNGIDLNEWNPAGDRNLPANFSSENLSGKAECKQKLLERFGLAKEEGRMLAGMVGRLIEQKGLDLLKEKAEEMLGENVAFVFLGTGMPEYEAFLKELAASHPDRVGVEIGYDEELAHLIVGGSDLFLIPSIFEPCGLTQMYALRYGTIPLARETGGLKDTIFDADSSSDGNGFTFADETGEAMLDALRRAAKRFADSDRWRELQLKGMAEDHSWREAAEKYIAFYGTLL